VTKFNDRELEKPIVIEVNGVFHFCRNSEFALGKDVLKRKLLQLYGYEVL
jgi:hypothetical protein